MPSTLDQFLYGGMGNGSLCIPMFIPELLTAILFPPLAVFIQQYRQGFKDVKQIVINLILTSCFYFPGMLHAMNQMSLSCGA